jgi:hypothetical protein
MIYRLLLTPIMLLSLATCQNQNEAKILKPDSSTKIISKSTTTSATPKKPEMSVGLPPDKDAVKVAKEENQQAEVNKGGMVYLKENENKFLKEYEMNVTFKKMIEDSRCPVGVNCIWAGLAVAEIEVMGLATRPMTIRISSMHDPQQRFATVQNFGGYEISLAEVTPEATTEKGFNVLKGQYKIGLKFRKADRDSYNSGESTTR